MKSELVQLLVKSILMLEEFLKPMPDRPIVVELSTSDSLEKLEIYSHISKDFIKFKGKNPEMHEQSKVK
jgi:hypothetical protein